MNETMKDRETEIEKQPCAAGSPFKCPEQLRVGQAGARQQDLIWVAGTQLSGSAPAARALPSQGAWQQEARSEMKLVSDGHAVMTEPGPPLQCLTSCPQQPPHRFVPVLRDLIKINP